jgi:hypothetical protein
MKVFPAASLSILGSNLSSVQAVSVGGVVYGPGQFSVIHGGRIDVTPGTPAALGGVPVTVTNPQGVSNALDLTWVGCVDDVGGASPGRDGVPGRGEPEPAGERGRPVCRRGRA